MSTESDTLDAVRELVDQGKPRPSLAEALTSKLEDGEQTETDDDTPAGDGEASDLRSALTDAFSDEDGE